MNMEHIRDCPGNYGEKVWAESLRAIIIIMAAVMVLGRITKDRKDHKDSKE